MLKVIIYLMLRLVGSLDEISHLIPRCGNYLYITLFSKGFIKPGKSTDVKKRILKHRSRFKELCGDLKTVIIIGEYEILGEAESELLDNCNKQFLTVKGELFRFSGNLLDLLLLIPVSCFDKLSYSSFNWIDSSIDGYQIDLKTKRMRSKFSGGILREHIKHGVKTVMVKEDIRYNVEEVYKTTILKKSLNGFSSAFF